MTNYTQEVAKVKNSTLITCIIPAWNEGKNIKRVLKTVTTFPHFNEIIVVDDGSEDNTSQEVKKFPKVRLIQHEKNKGKTAAVLTGIKKSRGELIVLIDADLIKLSHENISKMIYLILNKEYDMTILDRQGDREAIWGWTNGARFFGGERAFWREDFEKITVPEESGYLLEIIMNLYYIENNKKIKTIYCKNLKTVHQYQKIGKIKGYYSYIKMSKKIIEVATVKGYIKQIQNIEDEHKEIKDKEKEEKRLARIEKRKNRIYNKLRKKIGETKFKEMDLKVNINFKKLIPTKKIEKLRNYIKKYRNKNNSGNSSKK
ncbi:MAG: glycosyltransferase family 2 protein [archaeon]